MNISMGKTVIFLDYFDRLESIAPLVQKVGARLREKPIIVSLNLDANLLSNCIGMSVIYFGEFLSREDYESMDRYVSDLTENWYKGLRHIEGITGYKGIWFGALAEIRAQDIFSSAIKRLEIVVKAIERLRPDNIILIGEADVFQGLSIFIREELKIRSSFIGAREESISLRKTVKGLLSELICGIFDYLIRRTALKKRNRDGIFIDARLHPGLKDMDKQFHSFFYLIEKGLRIRLRLIRDKKHFFVPILIDDFFRFPNSFDRFYRYWKDIENDNSFKDGFFYKDLKIWKVMERAIRKLIVHDFYKAEKNVVFLEKFYKGLVPMVIVLREAIRMPEKTIVFTARLTGIPTLVVQHGILSRTSIYGKIHSNKIALWGKAGIDYYGGYGNDISKCVVTGNPKYDSIDFKKNYDKNESRSFFSEIGVSPDRETILYIPAHFKIGRNQVYSVYISQDQEYAALRSILNIAKSFPDKQVIIKIHPFDTVDLKLLYSSEIENEYGNVFIVKNTNLGLLIKNSSLVIASQFSSVVLEAVIFRKPAITLNYYKREDFVPFAERGVALSVTNSVDLLKTVKQIFEDSETRTRIFSNQPAFISDYAYKIDGKSTERVLGLIKDLGRQVEHYSVH